MNILHLASFVTWAATEAPAAPVVEVDTLGLVIGPALTAAVFSGLVSLWTLWIARDHRREEAADAACLDLDERAMNEFYAPIRQLLQEVEYLRNEIRSRLNGEEDGWHILDHIDEVAADPVAWSMFEEIVGVNGRIKAILDEKSGLTGGAVSASGRWRVHHGLLARTLTDKSLAGETTLSYFPTEFEDQVEAAHDKLAEEIDTHRGKKPAKKGVTA